MCSDATTFHLPLEALVLLFYNPFDAYVMEALLNRIAESVLENPRPVHILYLSPVLIKMFLCRPELRLVSESRGLAIFAWT